MVHLTISHVTRYRYRRPITLNPHRLMLRPREGRLLQVGQFALVSTPAAKVDWTHDVFGNVIALASFAGAVSELSIESRIELVHSEEVWPVFPISASAISYPFGYTDDERIDLAALVTPQFRDEDGRLRVWAKGFVAPGTTDTLALLKDLNAGTHAWIGYQSRDDYGTQTPLQSLDLRRGSCRDIATLLAEAVRHLGFAARLVSGYLWDPSRLQVGSAGSGSTHAWVEIYVPGAGWIAFDPTNGAVGAGYLIPVATARMIEQIAPVTGGFAGQAEDFLDMDVTVQVTAPG